MKLIDSITVSKQKRCTVNQFHIQSVELSSISFNQSRQAAAHMLIEFVKCCNSCRFRTSTFGSFTPFAHALREALASIAISKQKRCTVNQFHAQSVELSSISFDQSREALAYMHSSNSKCCNSYRIRASISGSPMPFSIDFGKL